MGGDGEEGASPGEGQVDMRKTQGTACSEGLRWDTNPQE